VVDIKKYDLHSHSNRSDGILSPEALVSRAKEKDVSVLALTDHDTLEGLSAARAQAGLDGLELINGIEFSTLWQGRNIHIVGLGFDDQHAAMIEAVKRQKQRRAQRALSIAEKLEKQGFEGIYLDAEKQTGGGVLGRPHFAKAMVERGDVDSVDAAFKRWLGNGKVGDVKQVWPSMREAAEAIVKAGGVAVLAHPSKYKLTRTKLCQLIEEFVDVGGAAIEVVSGSQDPNESKALGALAKKYNLMASCGSDFHSPEMPWNELGRCPPLPEGVEPVWAFWQ
jgi:predicted metal-dependent phosphoesterase TrpH